VSAPVPFSSTLASLAGDRTVAVWAIVAGALTLFLPISIWLTMAEIQVVESSAEARIERPHVEVHTEVSGRLTEIDAALDREVAAGDVLARLDDALVRGELASAAARVLAVQAELGGKRAEAAELAHALASLDFVADAAGHEAAARTRAARSAASFARTRSEHAGTLGAAGVVGAEEAQAAKAQARELAHMRAASGFREVRVEYEYDRERIDARVELQRVQVQVIALEGALSVAQLEVQRLTALAERYVVRAPVSGQVAQTTGRRPGEYLQSGDKLGTLVTDEAPIVVAHFSPRAASGRARVGHGGLLYLDGFPWPQFDPLPVTVVAVSQEASDGLLRVELALDGGASLSHGLEGRVDLAVETIAPVDFVLRALGDRIADGIGPGR